MEETRTPLDQTLTDDEAGTITWVSAPQSATGIGRIREPDRFTGRLHFDVDA